MKITPSLLLFKRISKVESHFPSKNPLKGANKKGIHKLNTNKASQHSDISTKIVIPTLKYLVTLRNLI